MPPTKRASRQHSKSQVCAKKSGKQPQEIKRRNKNLPRTEDSIARCTRSQTALRFKENEQVSTENKLTTPNRLDGAVTRRLNNVSSRFNSEESYMTKEAERKEHFCGIKRKRFQKYAKGKQNKNATLNHQNEENASRDLVDNKRCEEEKCVSKPFSASCVKSRGVDMQTTPSGQSVKSQVRQMRQRISQERAAVARLREELARNKNADRASLSCRRIRIHKELFKLKAKMQSRDRKRLKAEEARIQRELEASKRKADSDRISMSIELIKEWKDRFRKKKKQVQKAKRILKEQIQKHEVEKKELLKQLRKDWSIQLDKLQALKDGVEVEMAKVSQQLDSDGWTAAIGKRKYSLRQSTVYVIRKPLKISRKNKLKAQQQHAPPSGGALYKEAKYKMLMELYEVLDSELRCSICSEVFISAVALSCSHTFCSYCITQWKKQTNRCPICRTNISTRNSVIKLDSFITKLVRKVGWEVEKKRLETIKERKDQEKKVQEGMRSWGNFANHPLDELDLDVNNEYYFNSDGSVWTGFLEMIQHQVQRTRIQRLLNLEDDLDDDDEWDEEMEEDDDDMLLDSDSDLLLSSSDDDDIDLDDLSDDSVEDGDPDI